MRKYHVAVEQIPNSSIMGMFGGISHRWRVNPMSIVCDK